MENRQLGWGEWFERQQDALTAPGDWVGRVMDFYMRDVEVEGASRRESIPLLGATPSLAVGDWVVVNEEGKISGVFERKTLFRRKAAGTRVKEQIVAANVDVAFIVCSLNEDYSLNRIERYMSLAHEAGVEPVVVLSKADLCSEDVSTFVAEVQALDPLLGTIALDTRDADAVARELGEWCKEGQTIVLLGSSGSGKSTLTNTLLGGEEQETGAIKESDGKGRHTTTRRSLFTLPSGALVLDTPGMRELQLMACETGVATTFSDIEALAEGCKFNDCKHQSEPGCAVLAAAEAGELDARRLDNYHKLMREQSRNAATLAQRHAANRRQTRDYQRTQAYNRERKSGQ